MWTAVFSVAHVIFALQAHGGLTISGILTFFVRDGRLLTNSFGLGNWTGLAGLVIVVGLLAISSDLEAVSKPLVGRHKSLPSNIRHRAGGGFETAS
jgi:hypothetical protein